MMDGGPATFGAAWEMEVGWPSRAVLRKKALSRSQRDAKLLILDDVQQRASSGDWTNYAADYSRRKQTPSEPLEPVLRTSK